MKSHAILGVVLCLSLIGYQDASVPQRSQTRYELTPIAPDNSSISGERRHVFGTVNDDMARSVFVSGTNVVVGGQQNLRDVIDHKESSGFVCDMNHGTCDSSNWKSMDAPAAKTEIWGVVALGSGNFAVAGKTNGAVTSCIDYRGGEDGFVGANTADASTCSHFAGNHNDEGLGMAIGPDYTYVVGTIGKSDHQDALVVRYDGTDFGVNRTRKGFSFGGPGLEEIFDVAVGDNEMIYVTGRTSNNLVVWCKSIVGAQCWGADINRGDTDLFVAGIHSDAGGMTLSWLYQQEAKYSTGQGLAYYTKNAVSNLVVVGEIDEGIDQSADPNCLSARDRSDGFKWTNGLVLKFGLDEVGVHSDSLTFDMRTYGSCTDDAVTVANGETFKSVAIGDTYIFVAGAMRAAGAVCPGTPFFPHCESNNLEDAVLLALDESDLSIFESYEFVGVDGNDSLDIFFDVAVEGGVVYMVGATKSIHPNNTLAGGMDAFVVKIDEPN